MSGERIAGLVLAAGAGTRFGAPKALVELDGEPLVQLAVRRLVANNCAPIVVVVGAAAEQVDEGVDPAMAEVVVNGQWRTGLASSFRAGLQSLSGRADAVVITLVDQPGVTDDAVATVIEAWAKADRPAASAMFAGTQRPPVVLAAEIWDAAASAASGEAGAQVWLQAHPELVTEVPCDHLADLRDVDTVADLARFVGRGRQQRP